MRIANPRSGVPWWNDAVSAQAHRGGALKCERKRSVFTTRNLRQLDWTALKTELPQGARTVREARDELCADPILNSAGGSRLSGDRATSSGVMEPSLSMQSATAAMDDGPWSYRMRSAPWRLRSRPGVTNQILEATMSLRTHRHREQRPRLPKG